MIQVNNKNFGQEVTNYKGVVVVDFYADWCGPCKMLSPLMEEMSRENKDKDVKFVKINVDEEQELSEQFGVMSIPTVVFFKDGKRVSQRVGVATKDDYLAAIDQSKKPSAKTVSNEITVFSTPTCPYCHMAKEYLKEKKITFKDIDVSKNQAAAMQMVQRSGQMGVPQLWIKDSVVIGFNKPQIDMLLGL